MRKDHFTLGFSPCPNDTFIFDALVNGRIDTEGIRFDVHIGDVEDLNRRAISGELDITKLSFSAFGGLTARYILLNSGSALGHGVGPLLVRAKTEGGAPAAPRRVAIPGHYTTANYLLGLAYPGISDKTEVVFSEIEDAVLAGEFDAGLLIHENRFTYEQRGLEKIRDLGNFWEETTGLPIPLGGIAIKRNIVREQQEQIDRLVRKSVEYARAHPAASQEFVQQHAQAMDPDVMQQHIDLYVNEYTVTLGEEGKAAVRHFITDGRAKGLLQPGAEDYIV
ncbi:1,4-dihydroxy-6-naphthoate synthase [Neolewinella xylanilytica]|uniref:1,4-dihydroxy-6-naphtoate synthase n=1 Tax=Neolewinella xylanilytica TaxID=1514080 RepID=A0A2S6I5Z9_9BACT|nr:1,4-dihydroxy-6-naphthoate synthase [Neolewinella xylanilytica]PPK86592.1 1,4-dihydroxy-6-naphthoate synthase [Neolewinella xylanilytica]